MSSISDALQEHLSTGLTTLCRAWALTRKDGVTLGFTDHDMEIAFEGIVFRADSGMTAKALSQSTGLSVDNSEALGALSDARISEADIAAGRYDGAEVRSWLVNWADPSQRHLQFRGAIGDIRRGGGAFHAELRGLADLLNQPQGQVYHRACSAILGDGRCKFDLSQPGYSIERQVAHVENNRVFELPDVDGVEAHWFEHGRISVLSGKAKGLTAIVKQDRTGPDGTRRLECWEPLGAAVGPGDSIRVEPGCDKAFSTCRLKFDNLLNFRGFPDIPGEDWLMSAPQSNGVNDGGSRR